jgi:hypothetical protein
MDAFSVKPGIEAISILGINYGFTKFGEQCKSVDKKKWILPPIEYRDSKHLSMVSRDFAEYRPGLEDYPGLGDYPPYHEKIQYQTNQKSVFAETLYRSRVKEGAISDTLYRTSFYMNSASPYYSWGNSTFLGLIRYYFAKYIVVFESFDRITQCEYEPCKKLIFDIRSGRRRFCSDLCRKRFHDALQDNDKRLCREKQNVWIRRKMTPEIISRYPLPRVPGTIYRDDCQRCNGPVAKGGLCPALPYYNKKLFAALEKDKDHPRARRIQGLEFDRSRRTPTR